MLEKELIEDSLDSLESLNVMLKNRHRQGYEEGKRLEEFYIFGGAFFLDTCGNCMKADKFFPTFENVLTVDEFRQRLKLIGHTSSISYSYHRSIPIAGTFCSICEQKWNIENFIDATFRDSEFYHKKCLKIRNEQINFERFQRIFKEAKFKSFIMKPIENRYCKCDNCLSWYIVETPLCDFVIGDRKRVINIEWNKFDATKLFEKDDVTKGAHNIHAWSDEKAIEYLLNLNIFIKESCKEK